MIKRLFRWTHWRARSRYWRKRALSAESELKAEVLRNRDREDQLVTVPMRMAGLWGIPPRTEPAMQPIRQLAPGPVSAPSDPWDALSWADKNEFEMYWKPDATVAGVDERQAKQQFLLEIASRRASLNDDPYNAH